MFTNLSGMLGPTMTGDEKKVPHEPLNAALFLAIGHFCARYQLTGTLPAGVSLVGPTTSNNALRLFGAIFYRHGTVGSPVTPTTRPQRRNHKHMYYIYMAFGFNASVTDGTNFANLVAGGRWTKQTISDTDMTTIDTIPTVRRIDDPASVTLSATADVSYIQGYNAIIGGFPPNDACTAANDILDTTKSEIDAVEMTCEYRIAATPYGVPAAVPNSTGTDSLENWVPIKF
jgi:hypothetical protein